MKFRKERNPLNMELSTLHLLLIFSCSSSTDYEFNDTLGSILLFTQVFVKSTELSFDIVVKSTSIFSNGFSLKIICSKFKLSVNSFLPSCVSLFSRSDKTFSFFRLLNKFPGSFEIPHPTQINSSRFFKSQNESSSMNFIFTRLMSRFFSFVISAKFRFLIDLSVSA